MQPQYSSYRHGQTEDPPQDQSYFIPNYPMPEPLSPSAPSHLSDSPYLPYTRVPIDTQYTPLMGSISPYVFNTMNMPIPPIFRHKTTTTVELSQGRFIVDIPVPEKVVSAGRFTSGREFTHMRYTAVTGDPDEFVKNGYTLRQQELQRPTELFVVVTMYNEDEVLFNRTWKSVMRNISYLCSKRGKVWGSEGWKKVVVCIVADGRAKINRRTLNAIGLMGVYQEGVTKTSINGQDVSAHVFEYTSQIYMDDDGKLRGNNVPVQVLFCLKEKNAKKINSHRWFFNAFSPVLNPRVCVLIDVGTKPTDRSLYRLWRAFDDDPQVGGACGEIFTETGKCGVKLFNPLVAAQNFEYKISNILDKPLESVFGFISVLPGAFSAYRYQALRNGKDGSGPLEKYFIGEKMHGSGNITQANMYLAEDRILCFELVTKKDCNYYLKYVKGAKAETDVPDTIPEFIGQRRRWLNGSFFAGVHSLINFYQIFRSSHSSFRKAALVAEMIYFLVKNVFESETGPFGKSTGAGLFVFLSQLYIVTVIFVFLASLGNRPQGSRWLYTIIFGIFAIIMAFTLFAGGWTIYRTIRTVALSPGSLSSNFWDLVVAMASTYGSYFLCSFLYLDPWHMFHSFIQYLFFLPSFTNVLMVYAFCNLHDVSWGTKGDTGQPSKDAAPVKVNQTEQGVMTAVVDLPVNQSDIDAMYEVYLRSVQIKPAAPKSNIDPKQAQEDYFRLFRTRVVMGWVLSNIVLIALMINDTISSALNIVSTSNGLNRNIYLTVMLWLVAILSLFRFVGSILYLILR